MVNKNDCMTFFFNTRYIKLIYVMRMSYFLLCTINLNAVRFWYIPQENGDRL